MQREGAQQVPSHFDSGRPQAGLFFDLRQK